MAHDHAAHHSADDEYLDTPPGSTYEHTDAHVGIIVKFLLWLAISAVIIHFGLGGMYELLIRQATETEHPYPLAVTEEERLPPAPRLQQFPRNELYQFRTDEQTLLERYGWMNRDAGVVHIPIEEAMRLTVERGLLTSAPPVEAGRAAAPSGFLPADASSGRTLERRRP